MATFKFTKRYEDRGLVLPESMLSATPSQDTSEVTLEMVEKMKQFMTSQGIAPGTQYTAPEQTITPQATQTTTPEQSVPKSGLKEYSGTFANAFAEARRNWVAGGPRNFIWNGKKYGTHYPGEEGAVSGIQTTPIFNEMQLSNAEVVEYARTNIFPANITAIDKERINYIKKGLIPSTATKPIIPEKKIYKPLVPEERIQLIPKIQEGVVSKKIWKGSKEEEEWNKLAQQQLTIPERELDEGEYDQYSKYAWGSGVIVGGVILAQLIGNWKKHLGPSTSEIIKHNPATVKQMTSQGALYNSDTRQLKTYEKISSTSYKVTTQNVSQGYDLKYQRYIKPLIQKIQKFHPVQSTAKGLGFGIGTGAKGTVIAGKGVGTAAVATGHATVEAAKYTAKQAEVAAKATKEYGIKTGKSFGKGVKTGYGTPLKVFGAATVPLQIATMFKDKKEWDKLSKEDQDYLIRKEREKATMDKELFNKMYNLQFMGDGGIIKPNRIFKKIK